MSEKITPKTQKECDTLPCAFCALANPDGVHCNGDFPNESPTESPNETKKNMCCYIGCEKEAEWQLTDGNGVDDYTHACTDHVGFLLQDRETTVSPLKSNPVVLK